MGIGIDRFHESAKRWPTLQTNESLKGTLLQFYCFSMLGNTCRAFNFAPRSWPIKRSSCTSPKAVSHFTIRGFLHHQRLHSSVAISHACLNRKTVPSWFVLVALARSLASSISPTLCWEYFAAAISVTTPSPASNAKGTFLHQSCCEGEANSLLLRNALGRKHRRRRIAAYP